jgi:hypothetical protein
VIVIYFVEKKDIFACGNTIQYGIVDVKNQFFGGIRYHPFVL